MPFSVDHSLSRNVARLLLPECMAETRMRVLLGRKDVSETAFQPAHDLAEAAEGDALVGALQAVESGGRQAELFGKLGVSHFTALDAEKFAELVFQGSGHVAQARGEFIPDAECFAKSGLATVTDSPNVAHVAGGCRPPVQTEESSPMQTSFPHLLAGFAAMKKSSLLALVVAVLANFVPTVAKAVSDETEIFPFGSSWTWLHPQNGTDPETNQPGFQANWMKASWPDFAATGAGILGYGVFDWGAFATNIGTPPSGQRYTAYFKRHFTLPTALTGDFYANFLVDDGCVIYIDGVRVAEQLYTGADTYFGLASSSASEDTEVWRQLAIPGRLLSAGQHTIAVSVHNVLPTSSDLAFDLRLLVATGAANQVVSSPQFNANYQILWATEKIDWATAQTIAQQAGGRLPVIDSNAKNQFLFGLLSPDRFWVRHRQSSWVPLIPAYTGPWVGAYQPPGSTEPAGGWLWVDGSSAANAPWRFDQPDNFGSGEDRATYWGVGSKEATLNDLSNSDTATYTILVEFPYSPTISGVSPNPVPGSNSRQNFTITGANFDPNCTVTLRDLTTGIIYANRTKTSQTTTSITLNPNFGTPAHTWSVEVINPGPISSGQFQFSVTSPASLVGLAVSGPSSLAAGGSAAFTATASFSTGAPQDVTSQATWSVTGGPSGSYMTGHTLYAGTGSASVAHVQASYTANTGTRSGGLDVSIGTGLSATLGTPQLGFQYGSGSSLHYRVTATVNVSGGTGSASALWTVNGNPISGATGLTLDTAVLTPPGSGTVQVTVSDQGGHSQTAAANVRFDKAPQVNEQFSQVKAGVRTPGLLYAADGTSGFAFPPSHAGRDNGVVVIIHGLNDSVDSGWMKDMAGAIGNRLGVAAAPNVILYDWRSDAAPLGKGVDFLMSAAGEAVDIFPPGNGIRGVVNTLLGTTLITGAMSGTAFLFLAEALASRPEGEAHGFALASYLSEQIDAGNIDATKPIHLIGHSAGGFVAANCGLGLLVRQHPTKLQVTTLDTPFLGGVQVLLVKAKGGKFDRYVSSAFGELVPGVVALNNLSAIAKFLLSTSTAGLLGNTVTATELIPLDASYHVGADIDTTPGQWWQDVTRAVANHADAHDWYTKTVNTPNSYGEGFYYSPFLNHSFPASLASLAKTAASLQRAALGQSLVTGFSTFGNVSESSGSYTLVEQGNAGIYRQMTIPMNASTLKFNVQFTHAGDGDFLAVTFGNHPVLASIPDGDTFHGGSVPIEIPIVYLGGETGQLLFKLNGVGQDNAIVQIDSITITTDDDADHDGLTYAQETALGTDPRYADTDGDGISDGDEVNVYHTNPLLADTDGDGISDGDEIAAGTDPLDPKSNFKVVAAQRLVNGSFALSWSAIAGKTYRVLRSATVGFASFDVVAAGIEPVAGTASYTDASLPAGTTAAFYRVQME